MFSFIRKYHYAYTIFIQIYFKYLPLLIKQQNDYIIIKLNIVGDIPTLKFTNIIAIEFN
jgi:hypothetical protein